MCSAGDGLGRYDGLSDKDFQPRTIVITFSTLEERQKFSDLCKQLGHDEGEMATRLLTRFIEYCKKIE